MKCRHCESELKLPLLDRIDHLYQDRHEQNVRFFLHHGDMTDSSSLIRNIQQIQPDEIYNYHPENSHVIPALIRKFHEAKINNAPSVTVWGSGTPQREFLYSDMAAALTLSATAEFLYKTTDYHSPEHERGLLWSDPALGIAWPIDGEPQLAAKDAAAHPLKQAELFGATHEAHYGRA